MATNIKVNFDNSFYRLGEVFYSEQHPAHVRSPSLITLNTSLAEALNLNLQQASDDDIAAVFSGNTILPGSQPLAAVYAGHQFGQWNPQLGDGRAILLGEVIDPDGQRFDIQLKGSGETPYSRMGDGLAPLGPVLREYLVSEAMAALGVPTTRSLAAVTTGERVVRDRVYPAAILTRIASSHIRIGSFQFFASRQNSDAVKQLADHVIARHYPTAIESGNPYKALLENLISKQAKLIAQWQSLGFIHGVMNTDNMLVSGETIDYGPCAFLDDYDPDKKFSSIDHHGRYRYRNQPGIGHWNLAWMAQVLLPLLSDNEAEAIKIAEAALDGFLSEFQQEYNQRMTAKIGLSSSDTSTALVTELLESMAQEKMDFTLTFRRLAELLREDSNSALADISPLPTALNPWLDTWKDQLKMLNVPLQTISDRMLSINPIYIPRNHLVEEAITIAYDQKSYQAFFELLDRITHPFEWRDDALKYARPPTRDEEVLATFCGT